MSLHIISRPQPYTRKQVYRKKTILSTSLELINSRIKFIFEKQFPGFNVEMGNSERVNGYSFVSWYWWWFLLTFFLSISMNATNLIIVFIDNFQLCRKKTAEWHKHQWNKTKNHMITKMKKQNCIKDQ